MSVWSLLAVDFEILAQSREASSPFLNFLKLQVYIMIYST